MNIYIYIYIYDNLQTKQPVGRCLHGPHPAAGAIKRKRERERERREGERERETLGLRPPVSGLPRPSASLGDS